ncbi:unnamed protein product [Candidula unifasciata]|uniref:G-protein coupled receptors family 1 profile domain-containing protein n=1 Tax=Candidula unifasciata TaxID=100452 RepID=A0A8S3ZRX9_9EUPU|nr:unnamed protein product [Candidula unifasciata]
MSSVLEKSVVITSVAEVQVVSWVVCLLIDLTTAPISAADAQLTICANDSNFTRQPVSDEERQWYLDHLQEETTRVMIPAIVFLTLLASSGLIGNTLVIIVYARKPHWTGTVVLVITLAVLDLVANIIAIPAEIYDMFHTWDFNNPHLCRARLFTSAFTTLSAGMILVAIAVIRYRKVCCPHRWQINPRDAKVISIVVSLLGASFSAPYAFIKGRKKKPTPYPDIVAYECTTDDEYANTIYPLVIYVFFLMLYIACSISVSVLYILIGAKAWKHSKMYGGASPAVSMYPSPYTNSYRGDSNAVERCCNQNKCNCTRCESPCSSSVNMSTRPYTAGQSSSHFDNYEMKWFRVSSEKNEAPIRCNIPIFSNGIEVHAPVVAELFVQLHKTQLAIKNHSCHENRQYNADNRNTNQTRYGEDMRTNNIRMTCGKDSDVKIKTVKFNLGDTDTNEKNTDNCTDGFHNAEYKLKATTTNDTSVNFFHSNKPSVKTVSLYDKCVPSFKRVENDRRYFPVGRTTVMLFIISAFYILCYLPHLTIMFIQLIDKDAFKNRSTTDCIFYHLFLRTFFINCAVNPIVYSLFDGNFRRECFKILRCSFTHNMDIY